MKPLDLSNLIRHAFLSGRGLKAWDQLSDDDMEAWVNYDPTNLLCYQRIETAITGGKQYHIAWNEARTVGVICQEGQMAYELRKGAQNSLGIVTPDFCEAWGDMTADDNCTTQMVRIPA